MPLTRRNFLAASTAASVRPRMARAADVIDATERTLPIPAKVQRMFPAGPPAAILLYILAPDLLLGWPCAQPARGMRLYACRYMHMAGGRAPDWARQHGKSGSGACHQASSHSRRRLYAGRPTGPSVALIESERSVCDIQT